MMNIFTGNQTAFARLDSCAKGKEKIQIEMVHHFLHARAFLYSGIIVSETCVQEGAGGEGEGGRRREGILILSRE